MKFVTIRALVRNDVRLYLHDRRALMIGVLVPILIAAFFGYVFGDGGANQGSGKIAVALVDEDRSTVSQAIGQDLSSDPMLTVTSMTRAEAQAKVQSGKLAVAIVLPINFGAAAVRALFGSAAKPEIQMLLDPSQAMSSRVVEGVLAEHGMQEITRDAFAGSGGQAAVAETLERLNASSDAQFPGRQSLKRLLESVRDLNANVATAGGATASPLRAGLSLPYSVSATPITSGRSVPYNGYAHSFAGMTVQFILFAGIDAGIVLLLARERGIWQRLRSAPLSRAQFLFARALATSLIGLFQLTLVYTAAVLLFKVRISSLAGFCCVAVVFCLLNACFGLMLAALGRSPGATRGIAMMVTLLLVMLGGAWVPSFVFPAWLQHASLLAPTRWAVDALDAVTWRGLGLQTVLPAIAVLAATAAACLLLAIWRFRWED